MKQYDMFCEHFVVSFRGVGRFMNSDLSWKLHLLNVLRGLMLAKNFFIGKTFNGKISLLLLETVDSMNVVH